MKRGLTMLLALATAVLVLAPSVMAQKKYPVSVGFAYGRWAPSLAAYNTRFLEEHNPTMVPIGGNLVPIRVRFPMENQPVSVRQSDNSLYEASPLPYTFSADWGFGANARVRLHNDLFVLVEYDMWSQKVGSRRNYDGLLGYEEFQVDLNPVTASLVYELPTESNSRWWPKIYIGGGAGVAMVTRTNIQVSNTTPIGGSVSESSGSGLMLNGLAGLEFVIPFSFLQDRISLFGEARFTSGQYQEVFPVLGASGQQLDDRETGDPATETVDVSVQGAQLKGGMQFHFGEIRNRPEKGVLTGFLESRSRRVGGFAMAPMPGYGGGGGGGGVTIVYPQQPEQVQVVEGAPQIDEDRLRQIIRDELMASRMGASDVSRPTDTLAEEQLRSIRLRRLQAEQELEQLQELFREEG